MKNVIIYLPNGLVDTGKVKAFLKHLNLNPDFKASIMNPAGYRVDDIKQAGPNVVMFPENESVLAGMEAMGKAYSESGIPMEGYDVKTIIKESPADAATEFKKLIAGALENDGSEKDFSYPKNMPGVILTANGQPFADETAAKSARTRAGGTEQTHEILPHDGGFALKKIG